MTDLRVVVICAGAIVLAAVGGWVIGRLARCIWITVP